MLQKAKLFQLMNRRHMDVKAPFVSVVVPTRNRADLLTQSALPTVLCQTFGDFEVVVCDNASNDDTKQKVEALGDSRIKFFRSEEWIPKEDFFQWSLERATGEYSMLFFDDDALCRRALEKCHAILREKPVEALTFARSLVYHFPNWHSPQYRNVLSIPPFTRKALLIDSRAHLKRVFQYMDILQETPMVTNALYRTSFIKDLAGRYGRLFPHGHMGDYNVACLVLHHTEEFVYLDDPIAVFGHWKENTSAQLHDFQTTMPEYQEWIDWITAELLPKMPWTQYLWPNCVAAALEDMNDKLGMNIKVDPVQYWFEMFREIKRVAAAGGTVDHLVEDLQKVLIKKASPITAQKVMNAVRDGASLKQIPDQLSVLNYQDANRAYPNEKSILSKQYLRKSGKLNGFDNVSDACKFFELISGEEKLLNTHRLRPDDAHRSTSTMEATQAFSGARTELLGDGDYSKFIRQTPPTDWRRWAAEALIGKAGKALQKLPDEKKDPEARFYLGVAHWMEGNDEQALAVLRSVETDHARNLAALIAKPKLRVMAQTDWFPEDFQDEKFAVQFMGIRREELGPHGSGIPARESPHDAFENITQFATMDPVDFYFAHMVEWELLPRDLPELECPKIALTSDIDWHAQELHPWLPVFDEVVATGSEECAKARGLDPEASVSVFPKVFGLRNRLLPELPNCNREVNLFVPGSSVDPFHKDKAQLIRQLLDSRVNGISYMDGSLGLGDYVNKNGHAKAAFTYVRHPGTMPTLGLEALAMGCAVVVQKGNALSLYYGESEGVLSYDEEKENLPAQVQHITDHWQELGPRLQETAKAVRQDFNLSRCISQFLRYATVLAAKPRVRRRKPAKRHLLVSKRHFAQHGHPQTPPAANLMLQHNWRCWDQEYRQHQDPRSLINMGRELDLFLDVELNRMIKQTDGNQAAHWRQTRKNMINQVETVYEYGIRTHAQRLVLLFNALRHAFHIGNPTNNVAKAIQDAETLLRQSDHYWEIDPLDDVFPRDFKSDYFNYRQYLEIVNDWLATGNDRKRDLIRLIRASVHYYLGHYQGSLEHFEQAKELDPDFPYYRYYLAIALLNKGDAEDICRAISLLENLARNSVLMETAHNTLANLYERGIHTSPLLDNMASQLRRLKQFRMGAFDSSSELDAIDLVLPPDTKALPTQKMIQRQASSLQHTLNSSHCVNVGRVGKRKQILLIPFELSNWKNGRAWSYTGNFGFEEGLMANGMDCTVMPAIAGMPSDHKASWLNYANKLLKGRKFDQVWIWVTHNKYTPEFFKWLKSVAPVRVGIVMESIEHTDQEKREMAHVGTRKEKVLKELRHLTHVVSYDDADPETFEKVLGLPSLWCPIFVPWRSVRESADLPTPGPGVFYGSTYNAERLAYLSNEQLKDHLIHPELPEIQTPWPKRFDRLQANCLHYLNTNHEPTTGDFDNYVSLLRSFRRELFNLWLEGLRKGYATINLPSICKFYPGRVVESMAAGRPVITPKPNGDLMQRLFEPGRDVLWYDRKLPATLADQIEQLRQNPTQAEEIVRNAREKILKYHTAEIRTRQILDWIESGTQPDYGLTPTTETLASPPAIPSGAPQVKPVVPKIDLLETLKTQAFEHFQQGKLEESKMAYQQLTNLMPEEPGLWVELATVYLRIKDAKGFEKALNQALQLDPTDFEARRLLAHANFMGERYDDASNLYAGLFKEQPDDLELTLAYGAANFHTCSYRNAAGAFEHALELDPSNEVARDNLKATHEALAETVV